MTYKTFRILSTMVVILMMAAGAVAQTSTTGALEGRVTDASGPIPGVTVEISSPSLQGTRVAVTDSSGHFRFSLLPPGNYTMVATLAGFSSVRQANINVGLGSTRTVDVRLSPSAVSQEITVTAEAPVVDVTSTKTGANVTAETMRSLPIARDFYAVAQVAPGTDTDLAGTTFYGSTGAENAYIIDGLNTTGVELGTEAKTLNFDFIQEVEVLTGGLPAEYGRITGGVINAITKSGGNEFSGGLFGFHNSGGDNDTATDWPLTRTSIDETDEESDYGFDLGGYIMKDRLWFFGAYNRINESEVDTFIRDLDIPGFRVIQAGEEIPTDITSDVFAGKLTLRIDDNNTLALSAFGDPTERDGALFVPAGPPTTYEGVRETGGTDFVLRYSGIFGGSWVVNALAGQHHEEDTFAGAGRNIPQYIDLRGETTVLTGGFGFFQDQEFDRDTVKFDVSKFVGNHDIKVGGDVEMLSAVNANWNGGAGQRIYIFETDEGVPFYRHRFYINEDTFVRADPSTWDLLAPLVSEPETDNTSLYIQDSWRMLPNFTLNAGVRWEKQEIIGRTGETNIEIDDNFSPRLGLIWDVLNNGRSKAYANYGRFFESVPMDINIRAFGGEVSVFSYNFSPEVNDFLPDPNAPFATRVLGGHITPVDPNLKGQYIDEFLIGYEQEIANNLSVGIKGTYRDLGRVIEDFLIVGTGDYAIANPGSGIGDTVTFYDYWTTYDPALSSAPAPEATREFIGVELSARKRFSNNTQFFASYLWSELEGNYDGVFQVSTGQLDPNINSAFDYADFMINSEGLLSNDREHQFKFYGSYTVPDGALDGLNLGLAGHYSSGFPITAYGYSFLYQNWEYYLTPRGSLGRHPAQYEADFHIGYPVRLGGGMELNLLLDVFNLFDRQSIIRYDERYNLASNGPCAGFGNVPCNDDNGIDNITGTTDPAGQLANPRATAPNPDFLRAGVQFTQPRSLRFGVRLSF